MSSLTVKSLLEHALDLPQSDRASLALELIRSLEPTDTAEVNEQSIRAAWSKEIAARIDSIVKGECVPVDWETAMEEDRRKVANGDLD